MHTHMSFKPQDL